MQPSVFLGHVKHNIIVLYGNHSLIQTNYV